MEISIGKIEKSIHTIRGLQVMLDSHLAEMYLVETKILNQAVKRNLDRFPKEFRFQLTHDEMNHLRSQIVTSSITHGGRRVLAFVAMRRTFGQLQGVIQRLEGLEIKQLQTDLEVSNGIIRWK
jgi:hypothetical protein